jgi:hypothetical protein
MTMWWLAQSHYSSSFLFEIYLPEENTFPTIREAWSIYRYSGLLLYVYSDVCEINTLNQVFNLLLSYKADTSVGLSFESRIGQDRTVTDLWVPKNTNSLSIMTHKIRRGWDELPWNREVFVEKGNPNLSFYNNCHIAEKDHWCENKRHEFNSGLRRYCALSIHLLLKQTQFLLMVVVTALKLLIQNGYLLVIIQGANVLQDVFHLNLKMPPWSSNLSIDESTMIHRH